MVSICVLSLEERVRGEGNAPHRDITQCALHTIPFIDIRGGKERDLERVRERDRDKERKCGSSGSGRDT